MHKIAGSDLLRGQDADENHPDPGENLRDSAWEVRLPDIHLNNYQMSFPGISEVYLAIATYEELGTIVLVIAEAPTVHAQASRGYKSPDTSMIVDGEQSSCRKTVTQCSVRKH